jgi:hypothetical protein
MRQCWRLSWCVGGWSIRLIGSNANNAFSNADSSIPKPPVGSGGNRKRTSHATITNQLQKALIIANSFEEFGRSGNHSRTNWGMLENLGAAVSIGIHEVWRSMRYLVALAVRAANRH